jgi:hypothetical protein
MERSYKIKGIFLFLLTTILIFPIPATSSTVKTQQMLAKSLEDDILKALGKNIQCKKTEVQVKFATEKAQEIKSLIVKFEGITLGAMLADHMAILLENPAIDVNKLRKTKEFKILTASKTKVNILISAKAIEAYLANKAKQLQKKANRISIKFAPPFIECLFDAPVSEISPETLKLLEKFVKGTKLEGYAAIQIKIKDNAFFALPSKVIVNHFLIPDVILRELQNKFNPFDGIPVLSPFQYSISTATVQNQYLYLTNSNL